MQTRCVLTWTHMFTSAIYQEGICQLLDQHSTFSVEIFLSCPYLFAASLSLLGGSISGPNLSATSPWLQGLANSILLAKYTYF